MALHGGGVKPFLTIIDNIKTSTIKCKIKKLFRNQHLQFNINFITKQENIIITA